MKGRNILFGFAELVFAAMVILAGFASCGSSPEAAAVLAPQPNPAASTSVQVEMTESVAAPAPNPYYTREGGKGLSLAILAPQAKGLVADQDYLPALVQEELVSNFTGYSAISVLDRVQLDNQYAELFSDYYDDSEEKGMDLGHLTPTDYIMGGSITKTATGYALQPQITKTEGKTTAASYSGTCDFAELDNLSGVRRVSLELLQKIGIEPTERTKTELAGAAATNHVNVQTALAQGITAQQGGTVVEVLSYYYQVAAFDSSLLEVTNRASVMSAAISSGNIGENVRNDIQRRKEWQKILTEAEVYFGKHLPWEIVYSPTLVQGKVDYTRETVDLSCNLEVKPTDGFKIVNTILAGLVATGKITEWNMEYWPLSSSVFVDRITARDPDYGPVGSGDDMYNCTILKRISVRFQLINAEGKVVAATNEDVFCPLRFAHFRSDLFYDSIPRPNLDVVGQVYGWDMSVLAETSKENILFSSVNANDITDKMTIKIVSVNGIDAAAIAKTGYIKISTLVFRWSLHELLMAEKNMEPAVVIPPGTDPLVLAVHPWRTLP
jgi:hypothetical protein